MQFEIAATQHPGPVPAINCPPPPESPCYRSAAPVIDFQVGEESRLTATASLEDDAGVGNVVEARLQLYKVNANGGLDSFYTVTTTDAAQLGYMRVGSTQDFKFGVPGIDKDGEWRAQVAFCYSFDTPPGSPLPNRFCECWSPLVALTPQSTGWAVESPKPAKTSASVVMTQQAEDDFRRPRTVAKKDNNGNSLGGNGVSPDLKPWQDTFSFDAANGASISDAESAELAEGRVLIYSEASKGRTQYAEIQVHKATDDPGPAGKYNFDLQARLVYNDAASKAYAIKLTKGHVGPTENRNKHLLYVADTSVLSAVGGGGAAPDGEQMDVEVACGAVPPLASTGPSNAVWMRIVVENVSGVANITGWVAWDCQLDGNGEPVDIALCGRKCSKTWVDDGNALGLLNVYGQRSFSAHEHTYRVKTFRAGYLPGS